MVQTTLEMIKLEKARLEGLWQGQEEGKLMAYRAVLRDLLTDIFGQLPRDVTAAISVETDPNRLRQAVNSLRFLSHKRVPTAAAPDSIS